MSQDQPPVPHAEESAGDAAVVEWGDEPRRRDRAALSQRFGRLVRDRRLIPITAALGGVALFASLVSEWQITTIDPEVFGDDEVPPAPLSSGLGELDAWGGGYLLGLFLLVTAMVLLFFGPRPARVYARLVALSSGGVLLAVLIAITNRLGTGSLELAGAYSVGVTDHIAVTRGRGVYCALAGVATVLAAAYLAGRLRPVPAEATASADDDRAGDDHAGDQDGGQAGRGDDTRPAAEPADDWPWRRPAARAQDDRPPAPLDLTVGPAAPFVTPQDARDAPLDRRTGSTGISG